MSNSYDYCKKCTIKIPRIHSHIHVKECKCKGIKFCKKIHPFIMEGEMVSQIHVIKEDGTTKDNKASLGKWLITKEPDFMKSFTYEFTDKFAFFNELDLHHCRIKNFSQVQIQTNSSAGIFIAVAENHDNQQIGTVRLYEKGLTTYLQISRDCLFVTVRRINKLEEAKKIQLKVGDDIDKSLVMCYLKSNYCTNYELGWPYLLKKNGNISMQNLVGEEFTVEYNINEEDIFDTSILSDSFYSSENSEEKLKLDASFDLTIDSLKILSMTDDSLKLNSDNVEIPSKDEPNLKRKSFIRSSTPSRDVKSRKLSNSIDNSNSSNNSLTLSQFSIADDVNKITYYWLSHTTNMEVLSSDNKRQTKLFVKNNSSGHEMYEPTPSFYRSRQFNLLKETITRKLYKKDQTWSAILLLGLPGTGKSTLVKELCFEMKLSLITVNILGYSRSSKTSEYIYNCFREAEKCAPSVLLFEQFDGFAHPSQSKFISKILKILKDSKSLENPILMIGATDRPDLISPNMRQIGRFDKDIVIGLPDPDERAALISRMLYDYKHSISREDVILLGKTCFGFSPADIDFALRTAYRNASSRYKSDMSKGATNNSREGFNLEAKDLEEAVKFIVPSHLRDNYYSMPQVLWDDIWGYDDVKSKLKKLATEFSSGSYSKGLLFYGPPGCSKTMMAKALAKDTQFSFFEIKCSDLLSKYVGETEKALNEMMEKAFLSSPSLVFMDEIDSLCGSRDGTGGSESCIVPELLSIMKRAQKSGNILFVGATNRPNVLDQNLLSAGYFELLLHIDLPDCPSRCAIWEGLLKDVPKFHICVSTLCSKSEGFSCAEICGIYQKAAYSLIEDKLLKVSYEGEEPCPNKEDFKLTEELILHAIVNSSPRTSKFVLDDINMFAITRGRV